MKRFVLVVFLAMTLLLTMGVGIALAGNGSPSGFHENINVIGVNNAKNANYTGGNGSTIFISRTGSTQFFVYGGNSFAIVDHDGTDGKVGTSAMSAETAGLIFPYIGWTGYGTGHWNVDIYARLLGPTSASFRWTTEYYDGLAWVQLSSFTLDRSSKFSLKTGDVLIDGYRNILWTWDQKNDYRICQLRIYIH